MLNVKLSAFWSCYTLDPLLVHATYKITTPKQRLLLCSLEDVIDHRVASKTICLKATVVHTKNTYILGQI